MFERYLFDIDTTSDRLRNKDNVIELRNQTFHMVRHAIAQTRSTCGKLQIISITSVTNEDKQSSTSVMAVPHWNGANSVFVFDFPQILVWCHLWWNPYRVTICCGAALYLLLCNEPSPNFWVTVVTFRFTLPSICFYPNQSLISECFHNVLANCDTTVYGIITIRQNMAWFQTFVLLMYVTEYISPYLTQELVLHTLT